jgi:hypothetical protein
MPTYFRLSLPLLLPTKTLYACPSPIHPSAQSLPKSTNHEAPRYTFFPPSSHLVHLSPQNLPQHLAPQHTQTTNQVPFLYKTAQFAAIVRTKQHLSVKIHKQTAPNCAQGAQCADDQHSRQPNRTEPHVPTRQAQYCC